MWSHVYAAVCWIVGAPSPAQRPDPKPWKPVRRGMAGTSDRKTRSVGEVDDAITIERVVWAYERRTGDDSSGAVASLGRLDELLEERQRAMVLLGVWDVEPCAVVGPAV